MPVRCIRESTRRSPVSGRVAQTVLIVCGLLIGLLTLSPHVRAVGSVQGGIRDGSFGKMARRHITVLSEEIGARIAGSDSEARAGSYIEETFRGMGYPAQVQTFRFAGGPRGRRSMRESANIIAVKSGNSDMEFIVGAHYDSEVEGRGAGDNASGVGVMLEIAAAIRNLEVPYTVRFVAFGAEEEGLAGSRHYVEQMSQEEIGNVAAMINLDSLIAGDLAYVYGSGGEAGMVRDWVLRWAVENGFDLRTQSGENSEYPRGTTGDFSDHAAFEEAGIQYAYFESTNWMLGERDGYVQVDRRFGDGGYIWHTRFDTIDYIDQAFPGRVDARLSLFATLLNAVLTEFGLNAARPAGK